MKTIDNHTKQCAASKTVGFSLLPVEATIPHLAAIDLINNEKERQTHLEKCKGYIDRYHISFIEEVLSKRIDIPDLQEYVSLYQKSDRTKDEKKQMTMLEAKMRKAIASAFSADSRFPLLKSSKSTLENCVLFPARRSYRTDIQALQQSP